MRGSSTRKSSSVRIAEQKTRWREACWRQAHRHSAHFIGLRAIVSHCTRLFLPRWRTFGNAITRAWPFSTT